MSSSPARSQGSKSLGLRALGAAAMLLLIGACASEEEEFNYVERPVDDLYNEAMDTLQSGSNIKAAKLFDEVDRQHPYSPWAAKAQLMSAYAYYLENEYADAIAGLDRFIQLHPGNPDVAYAYYLKALSYYEQISDIGRDQSMTRLALESLEELTRRFPESKYTRDANLKVDLTRDHLAGKEMDVGRFYQKRGHYLSAINRFRRVVDQYETTSHTPEALHRLVECYLALGILNEAQETAAVLGYNYPGSEWYQDSYGLLTAAGIAGQ
ncbi:MAG: outer membrane protein assembly factor BamD [Kiloniellales bacterium]|nr:outer membrane protein assembly factor BamD [Kiloniellales bacterium]